MEDFRPLAKINLTYSLFLITYYFKAALPYIIKNSSLYTEEAF